MYVATMEWILVPLVQADNEGDGVWMGSFARFARIRRMFEISWAMLDGLMGAEGVKA